jgi:CxxC motif-containing protein (DUF1111 family)
VRKIASNAIDLASVVCLFGFRRIVVGLFLLSTLQLLKAATDCQSSEELSGGETTVFDDSRNAFTLSARNLSEKNRPAFFVGNSFFNENWIAAPASPSARDGLGPLFVTRSCSACHFKDGRSAPPEAGSFIETMAIRLTRTGMTEKNGGPTPDPVYGSQLQTSSLHQISPEAQVIVDYESIHGDFGDGEAFALRRPTYTVTNLGYGLLATNTVIAPLVSPVVIGLGLLEAIPEETLRRMEDPTDQNGDGISGKMNWVWDADSQRKMPGRFGWKAEQPAVKQQVAAAFNGDMGLTTSTFPHENHTSGQAPCDVLPNGGTPEVNDDIFGAVATYSRTLAVPARRDWTNQTVLQGQKIFDQLNCASCHTPSLKTADVPDFPELSRQTIRPYTDLLLHDMGEGLADNRNVFEANGREWRTPPLWGIGLVKKVNGHTFFLHDGRARNMTEAILWHGGEAAQSREAFRHLPKTDREALIRFLESL